MSKRLFLILLALCLALAMPVFAEETVPETTEAVTRLPNECGEGITWEYAGGTLTVTGDGAMDDFSENGTPWEAHKESIEKIAVKGSLSYIGAYAFKNCDALKEISFGSALYEIGKEAFASCDGLEKVYLPASFKVFGEGCFQSCKNLKEFHCQGRFPSFRQNCLWDTYATIYYPADNPWSTEYIGQLEEAFKGRIRFLASDGTDHYTPTEPPTEPEETVQETEIPETAPEETEPPVTQTPTQAPTEEPTQVPTQMPTEPEQTQPAPEEPEDEQGGLHIGFVIVIAVLAGLGLGALVFAPRKKGKYAR